MAEKKKSIFEKAIDALTGRDDKVEAESKEAAEAESRRKAAEATRERLKVKAEEDKKAAEVKAAAEKLAREKQLAEDSKRRSEAMMAEAARKAEEARAKFIAEYTVNPDDTLSHVALRYYKHATRDYWMLIYEANKDVIGDNPNVIRPGMVLQIPELPENLKD